MSNRNLTDAQRAERREADRDRLEQAARALLSSEGWQRWVRVRSTNGLSRYCLIISRAGCRRWLMTWLGCWRHVFDMRLWWTDRGPARAAPDGGTPSACGGGGDGPRWAGPDARRR
jgi:hypothetical protein